MPPIDAYQLEQLKSGLIMADRSSVLDDVIYYEGFDYTFTDYSNFEDVQDEEFHRLRKAYLESRQLLYNYLGLG